jgi:uncharacterized iron-regulated membrane protein
MRRFLFRSHIWLGWLVGGQLLLWMLSGLLMSAMPIGEVRGEHLRNPEAKSGIAGMSGLLPPETFLTRADEHADGLLLKRLEGRPVYLLLEKGEPVALFDAETGAPVRIDAATAARIAASRHVTGPPVLSVSRVDPQSPPLEFRRDTPAFAVRLLDHEKSVFYIHAVSGEMLAVRTDRWRLFDLMWGLHIMDWRGREDMNHPLLVGAAALGLLAVAGGIALLVLRATRRRGAGLAVRG